MSIQCPGAFAAPSEAARPLYVITSDALADWLAAQDAAVAAWLRGVGFRGAPGELALWPGADGAVAGAVLGLGPEAVQNRTRFAVAQAVARLPKGAWTLASEMDLPSREEAALAWMLAGYAYTLKSGAEAPVMPVLVCPDGVDPDRIRIIAEGECLSRDLINTPSNLMGPDELEAAARSVAAVHGAEVSVICDADLETQNFPLILAVGRASTRRPRLIDMTWGTTGPTLTLVGKGVCFDTGGLDIKPSSSMALMKKDMGGAATVLGLAHMIMGLGLPLQLRVLIPAVENAVSGNAFRPGDILTARNGNTVEINNTDAEGRLVLADALTLGGEANPDLMISMATLTGAARVAVGPDLAPFYSDDDGFAAALSNAAALVRDPVWRMPFHAPYETMIEPATADLDNAPSGGFAGSITAALFLRRFASGAKSYTHFDIYGWQPKPAPARPLGGTPQGARALLAALPQVLGFDG